MAEQFFGLQRQISRFSGQQRTGGQPDQVNGEGQHRGFVEIIHTPDQTAFHVPPGPEILDMQVADSQKSGSLGQCRTNCRPDLHPWPAGKETDPLP